MNVYSNDIHSVVAMCVFWRILSWEDFVLYLCTLMVSLRIYGILKYFFFPGRILSRRRILSSAFSLHYYLHSVVAMIEFWRILSREDFVLYLCTLMVSLMIYGILEYFFSRGGFCPGRGFCPLHILSITTYIQ
jgi:hypothetical protein